MINISTALLWGFFATLVLSTIVRAAREYGISRMDIPLMVGLMVTPDRDRARMYGFLIHLVNGWILSLLYAAFFTSLGLTNWWLGILLGLAHGIFVLVIGMPLLPGMHPRMASAANGPDPTRRLEPPGFLALNYGRRTPIITLLAHGVYGFILGVFY